MGEEGTLLLVERRDGRHIRLIQHKIKHLKVFFHAFDVRGLGNGDDSPLQMPAENDLGHRLSMFFADGF